MVATELGGRARTGRGCGAGTAAHLRAVSGQLRMNARRPAAALVNLAHTRAQRLVGVLSCRALALAPRVVPARGDTEHSDHRGDTELGLVRSHEPVDLPGTVSRAKQAVVFAGISRSSRTRRI